MKNEFNVDLGNEIVAAVDGLAALASTFESSGREAEADELYRICADLELRSPQLQACWGGPLNGQVGRRQIMSDLIERYRPTCIIETGTFRGLTTNWFAQHFDGPILTCEAAKRYFYQAERNLAKHDNVSVSLSDSRTFLAGLDGALPTYVRPLIYLDAHWEQDLPLREELRIVMGAFAQFVVVIDDFEVPGDNGYSWDDYGNEDALTIGYLAVGGLQGCQVLFPTLPSSNETGARRGCCVVSREVTVSLDDIGSLRGGSLEEWLEVKARADAQQALPIAAARPAPDVMERKQASYPDQIVHLRQNLQVSQNDAIAKEAVIQELRRTCDDRFRLIQDLTKVCDERLHVIDELVKASEA